MISEKTFAFAGGSCCFFELSLGRLGRFLDCDLSGLFLELFTILVLVCRECQMEYLLRNLRG